MRLLKSLYGLHQSPTNWWDTIDQHLVELGFITLKLDPCIYIYSEDGAVVILTLKLMTFYFLGNTSRYLDESSRN